MNIKLPTEHHLEFLSLIGGYIGSSESTIVKIPHCWKSHVTAKILLFQISVQLKGHPKCLPKVGCIDHCPPILCVYIPVCFLVCICFVVVVWLFVGVLLSLLL